MVSQDALTHEEVQRRDMVKGYEFAKNQYVVVTEEDFDSVKVESTGLMTVEKFVDSSSIDPIYYDASYFLALDGKGSEDVYAVLREAITRTGKVALTRVVIGQRERTIALRPLDGGLAAHTLNEQRDLNSAQSLFESVRNVRLDPEMVALATQLVERQSDDYDPADLEDRYETRLRAMLDAKLRGEGLRNEAVPETGDNNVIDLMAALKRSLGDKPPAATARRGRKVKDDEARRQPGFKLPLQGGKAEAKTPAVETASASGRKRA